MVGPGIATAAMAASAYGRCTPLVREAFCSGAALRSVFWIAVLTSLLGGAGEHGARVVDVDGTQRTARAERLVDDTVAALAAYPFDTVAALHGRALHERERPDLSEFAVQLAVTPTATGSLRIEGSLLETRSRRLVTHFVTYRGRT